MPKRINVEVPDRLKRSRHATIIPKENLLSSGATLFNLNSTGRTDGAFAKGMYYHLVGDSSSGKTYFALTCLAEAAINPNFADYKFIYDPTEGGNLFDPQKFWPILDGKVFPPEGTIEEPVASRTTTDFYDFATENFKAGPCIYILDSMDVLIPDADLEKLDKERNERRNARKKGKPLPKKGGSYGMAKGKDNSTGFREMIDALGKHGSILIGISQTRDKLQAYPGFGDDKTYSGGHSLKFYATTQIWTSVAGHIKKKVGPKDREQGIIAKVRFKKNRQVGKDRTCLIRFYHSVGIDDVGSNIEYLIEEEHWKGPTKTKVIAPEFNFNGKREDLVQLIERKNKEGELRKLVKSVWTDIENQCAINRKNKYDV